MQPAFVMAGEGRPSTSSLDASGTICPRWTRSQDRGETQHGRADTANHGRRDHRAPRPTADDPPPLEDGDADLTRRLLRGVRPVLQRLRRTRPVPSGHLHADHRVVVWHDRHRVVHRRAVRRTVRRHHRLLSLRRPLRPPRYLHLLAGLVQHRDAHSGVPELRRHGEPLAVHRRHRHRRRTGDDRYLHLGTRTEARARQGVRVPASHWLLCRAPRGTARLAARPRRSARLLRLALGGADRFGRCCVHLVAASWPAGITTLARAAGALRGGRTRDAGDRDAGRRGVRISPYRRPNWQRPKTRDQAATGRCSAPPIVVAPL